MADRKVQSQLGWEVNRQEERQAIQSVKRVEGAQVEASKASVKAIDAIIKEYTALARIEGNVERQTKSLTSELKRIGASDSQIAQATAEFDDLTASIRRAEQQTEQLTNRFDRVSQNVSLAGDVQSNLGGVREITDISGFTGLGQGIGVAGEFVVLAEELPRLKQALAGMPQTIGNAVSALGTGGIGLIGGIVAIGVVAKVAFDELAKAERAERARLDAIREAREFALSSNEQGIQAERERLEQQIQLEQELLAVFNNRRRGELNAIEDDLGIHNNLASALEEVGLWRGELHAQTDAINESQDSLRELTERYQALGEVQNSLSFQTAQLEARQQALVDAQVHRVNREADLTLELTRLATQGVDAVRAQLDATREEIAVRQEQIAQLNELGHDTTELTGNLEDLQRRELLLSTTTLGLAEARDRELEAVNNQREAILSNAQLQADNLRELTRLQDMNSAQLQARLDGLIAETQALEAERNALVESGDTSEQVADRIQMLNEQLMRNGELQALIRNQNIDLVREEENRIQVEQRLIQSTEQYNADVERLNEQRAQLEQRHADRLVSIAEKALADSENALNKLVESQRQANTEIERGNIEAQIEAQRLERDSLKDHLRKIRDIRDRNQDAEFEAELNSDFRQLFAIKRQKTRDINAQNQAFLDQRADQIQALDDQRADRLRAYQLELVDANRQYQQELNLIGKRNQQAIKAENERIRAERDAITQRLTLRRQGYLQEIQLAQKGAQALVQIEAQRNQVLLTQARQALNALITGGGKGFNFNGGGGSTTNNKTNNMSNTFNINGGNTQQVQRIVVDTIDKMLN